MKSELLGTLLYSHIPNLNLLISKVSYKSAPNLTKSTKNSKMELSIQTIFLFKIWFENSIKICSLISEGKIIIYIKMSRGIFSM